MAWFTLAQLLCMAVAVLVFHIAAALHMQAVKGGVLAARKSRLCRKGVKEAGLNSVLAHDILLPEVEHSPPFPSQEGREKAA